jgi:hypothetical protein
MHSMGQTAFRFWPIMRVGLCWLDASPIMMQEPSCCAIAVMAKPPEPGRFRTRLCPPVQPTHAAWLREGFPRDTFQNIIQAAQEAPIVGYATYAPAESEAAMKALRPPGMDLVLADGTPSMPPDVQGFG